MQNRLRMGSWSQHLRTCLTDPWAFEDDRRFRSLLQSSMHTGLRVLSGAGIVVSALYLVLVTGVHLSTATVWLPALSLTTVLRMGNGLLGLTLSVIGLLAARFRCTLREGRLFSSGAVVILCVAGLPTDLLAGEIHAFRLTIVFLAAIVAIPFQPWQSLVLGIVLVMLVGAGGFYGPTHLLGMDAHVSVMEATAHLGSFTLLLTGLSGLFLIYRYDQYRARVSTRKALQTSRTLLHRTEEMAKVGGWEYDLTAGRMSWTEELYRLHAVPLHYEPDLDSTIDFYAPEARPVYRSAIHRCIENGQTFQLELPFITANGSRRWVRTRGEAHVENGTTTRITGMVHDISDRKRMERDLRESEKRLRRAQRIAHLGNWERDLTTDTLLWSEETRRIFGWAKGARITYETFLERVHPDDRERVRNARADALQDGEPLNVEYRIQRPDGEQRIVHERGEVHEDDGHPVRLSGTVLDITERKTMERKVRESHMALSEAQKLARTGHLTINLVENSVSLSEECGRLIGLSPTDDRTVDDLLKLVHPKDRDRVRHAFARMHREPVHELEYRIVPEGREAVRWIRERGRPVRDDSGETERIFGVLTDITAQKMRAQQRSDRETKIEALYAATGRLLKANSRNEVAALIEELIINTFGYPITSVRLLDDGQLRPVRVSPQTRQLMPERPAYHVEDDTIGSGAFRRGDRVVVEDVRAQDPPLDYGAIRAIAYVPLGDRGLLSIGSPNVGGIDPFDLRLLEILAGNATVVLDRLEREYELVQAKETAEEASELKSAFLANMSHEIRTPLTSIIGFAEAIGDRTHPNRTSDPPSRDVLHFSKLIEKSGRRLLDTLNSVLDFSQLEAGSMTVTPRPLTLNEEIEDTVDLFQARAKAADVDLSIRLPSAPVQAHADPDALRRVIRNLVSNAVKFTPPGGDITVRAHESGDVTMLEVEDTGIGIDADFVPHLFDAFEQESTGSERAYEGSGLGLAVTKRLVHLMEATIEVETEKGVGTCFTIRLPQDGASPGAA